MIDKLAIRMYKMGFGDCFLLTFSGAGEADKFVLIDCGSITEGKAQVGRVAQDVIARCTPKGGGTPRIELVVATHRHRDHVGGFADPAWQGVQVGEVWMPWTEDESDPVALRIRSRQSSFAAALVGKTAIAELPEGTEPLDKTIPPARQAKEAVQRAISAVALNALTNEKAMATLHSGFVGKPKRFFLPIKDKSCEARKISGVPGLVAHVLGPPRNEAAIASMNPPPGGAYFRAAAAEAEGVPVDDRPAFGPYWQQSRAEFEAKMPGSSFTADYQRAVDDLAEEPDGSLAAAIDNAVNNTSLILMFEIGDEWLLFPGDAQWGNWNAALTDSKCRELMTRTTFYKVGHHGSHNATPRELIDKVIAQPFTAFFSTAPVKQWPDIPRAPLVAAIAAKAKCARSDDEAAAAAAGFDVTGGLCVEWSVKIG